jgi:TolA-binding protein
MAQFSTIEEGTMTQLLLAVGVLVLLMSGMAYAEGTETPRIDQRQVNQEQRIDQGIASGQLNEKEAARLNHQQDRIDNMENKAKADGTVTNKERAKIAHAQDRASRHIAREKHDRQGARPR